MRTRRAPALFTASLAAGCGLGTLDTAQTGQDKPPNADEAAVMFDASRRVVVSVVSEAMDAVVNGESYLDAYAQDAGWVVTGDIKDRDGWTGLVTVDHGFVNLVAGAYQLELPVHIDSAKFDTTGASIEGDLSVSATLHFDGAHPGSYLLDAAVTGELGGRLPDNWRVADVDYDLVMTYDAQAATYDWQATGTVGDYDVSGWSDL